LVTSKPIVAGVPGVRTVVQQSTGVPMHHLSVGRIVPTHCETVPVFGFVMPAWKHPIPPEMGTPVGHCSVMGKAWQVPAGTVALNELGVIPLGPAIVQPPPAGRLLRRTLYVCDAFV
jgi:hypothetical protein